MFKFLLKNSYSYVILSVLVGTLAMILFYFYNKISTLEDNMLKFQQELQKTNNCLYAYGNNIYTEQEDSFSDEEESEEESEEEIIESDQESEDPIDPEDYEEIEEEEESEERVEEVEVEESEERVEDVEVEESDEEESDERVEEVDESEEEESEEEEKVEEEMSVSQILDSIDTISIPLNTCDVTLKRGKRSGQQCGKINCKLHSDS